MIAKKIFNADGSNTRFLSDFIIKSEQFTRVYNYVYDVNGVEGSVDPTSGLFIRTQDAPNSDDLIGIDKWDLVDNSISFYIAPHANSTVWIEVATTSEEFGDTLVQPSVERAEAAADAAEASKIAAAASEGNAANSATAAATSAANALTSENAAAVSAANASTSETNAGTSETNAAASEANASASETAAALSETNAAASEVAAATSETNAATSASNAQLRAWEAEAEQMTADSYATQAEDVFVNIYTSDGDGTFTATPTTEYSALHWSAKALTDGTVLRTGDTMTGNLEVPSMSIGGDYLSPYAMRNKLINGGFDIWQRGDSFNTNVYTADRWVLYQNGETASVIRSTNTNNILWEGAETVTFGAIAGANTGRNLQQKIENVNLFKNKDMTFSLTHNASVGQDIYISLQQIDDTGATIWSSGAVLFSTGDGSIKRDSYTVTLPDIIARHNETNSFLAVKIFPQYTEGSQVIISQVQLEEGLVATPFEQRPIGLELSLCQRYYFKSSEYFALPDYKNGVEKHINISFPTSMRVAPTTLTLGTISGGTISGTAPYTNGFRTFGNASAIGTTMSMSGYTADAEL